MKNSVLALIIVVLSMLILTLGGIYLWAFGWVSFSHLAIVAVLLAVAVVAVIAAVKHNKEEEA